MKLIISDETLKKTDQCTSNFQCLTEPNYPRCTVDRLIEDNGVFIKNRGDISCPYLISFGYSFICNCPVRYEIFKQYNK